MQQILAVPRQEIDTSNGALLEALIRVQGLTEAFGVAAYQFALQRLGSGGLRVELLELMLHFRMAGRGGVDQRLVEFLQLTLHYREVFFEGLLRRLKSRLEIAW